MKRLIPLAFLTALLAAGCDGKKAAPQATAPSATQMFDKGNSPRGDKGSKGKLD
jgi:hypothetical protein